MPSSSYCIKKLSSKFSPWPCLGNLDDTILFGSNPIGFVPSTASKTSLFPSSFKPGTQDEVGLERGKRPVCFVACDLIGMHIHLVQCVPVRKYRESNLAIRSDCYPVRSLDIIVCDSLAQDCSFQEPNSQSKLCVEGQECRRI